MIIIMMALFYTEALRRKHPETVCRGKCKQRPMRSVEDTNMKRKTRPTPVNHGQSTPMGSPHC